MKKLKITADTIGHGIVSLEQQSRNKYKRETLTAIGMFPTHYDGGNITNKQISKDKFSTNYETIEQFNRDRLKILDYLDSEQNVPVELLKKVSETVKELNMQSID